MSNEAWMYEFDPHPKQEQALVSTAREILYGGAVGGGKDLALDTPVLTTGGWKTQGTLEVGDFVYGPDGQPTQVVEAYPVESNPCYKITFSTGESIIAGEGHLWNVSTQSDRDQLRRNDPVWKAKRRESRASRAVENPHKGSYQASLVTQRNKDRAEIARQNETPADPWDFTHTLETKDIYALAQQSTVTIPRPKAIAGGVDWPSEVPPYVLGMYLGDGSRQGAGITQGSEDKETLLNTMKNNGFYCYNTWGISYFFRSIETDKTLDSMLNSIYGKTSSNTRIKHIPDWVYTTSYEDRLAVIQGLFDADAHVSQAGRVEFCLTDQRLFEDTLQLLSTLGIRVSYTTGVAAYTKNGGRKVTGTRYRTSFTTEIPVFTYPRKLVRINQDWVDNYGNKRSNITIVSIEPCETVPTRCISVDNDRRLYLAGSTLIPTHNSEVLLAACVDLCTLVPGAKALLVRRTTGELTELKDRLRKRIPKDIAFLKQSENIYHFTNGSMLIMRFLDSEEDATKVQGFELQLACFDELTHYEQSWYAEVLSRLRATGDVKKRMDELGFVPRALSASNPGGRGHTWVKERFVDPAPMGKEFKPNKNSDGTSQGGTRLFIQAFVTDNPFIENPEEYIENSLGALDPIRKRALVEGDWSIVSGVRFPQFYGTVIVDEDGNEVHPGHVVTEDEFPIDHIAHTRVIGVDIGFDDPAAFVWIAYAYGHYIVYREFVKSGLDQPTQAKMLLELEEAGERRASNPITIAIDPSAFRRDANIGGQKYTQGGDAPIGSAAFHYRKTIDGPVIPGMNNRIHGWANIDTLLAIQEDGLPGLLIYDTCPLLIKTIQSAPRQRGKGEDVQNKPKWHKDHVLDALRYGIAEIIKARPKAILTAEEKVMQSYIPRTETGDLANMVF